MKIFIRVVFISLLLFNLPNLVQANEQKESTSENRMALYFKTEALSNIPWYYIAAIDQYERNINKKPPSKLVAINFPSPLWNGALNPSTTDAQPMEIVDLFNGIGRDGNGDNIADRTNPEDILFTMAEWIKQYGITRDDVKIAVWNYYHRDLTVQTIMNIAKVFETFQTIDLTKRAFPVPIHANYSYRNTWGDPRGFGGRRIHEGTDIFANYGVPVRSTTYGVVEMKGWNRFGGWRIGIRDINNIYHYYAHLNGFEKNIKVGKVVKPGDVVGYVGASGYGPPGTSGKFPPHLHYGMYLDNGYSEWSFDPYPRLKRYERESRKNRR